MTNEQILWLARVRVGLQKADIRVNLMRVTRDRPHLEAVLNRASELTDETAVESAMKLMAQLGMINGSRAMALSRGLSITRQNSQSSLLDSPTQMGLLGNLSLSTASANSSISAPAANPRSSPSSAANSAPRSDSPLARRQRRCPAASATSAACANATQLRINGMNRLLVLCKTNELGRSRVNFLPIPLFPAGIAARELPAQRALFRLFPCCVVCFSAHPFHRHLPKR